MKIQKRNGPHWRRQSGFATLVVFILLGVVVAFVIANALTLERLKHEIRSIEKRQLSTSGSSTNGMARPPTRVK